MNLPRIIEGLARALAILGGMVLGVIIILTVVSITGRALIWAGLGPIPGDFEIVEALTGFAVFCFLPFCQLMRGHAILDIFTNLMGPTVVRYIDAFAEIVATIVLALIAWRLTYGFFDKFRNGETSFIVQFPTWWAYASCLLPAYVSVITGLLTSTRGVKSALTGRDLLPEHHGVE
jgi:TRAP-type C4-dicarboxylate transport system permease small subunit